ncbi:LysM domain-containing protein [Chloropicon roscoffensis]|uniref:LysM domain-containing protein n=1 Tax=Chloropicon roscoffensis TaxID=1461544 RepID=A0AAX4PNS3_9CHLO
MTFSHKKLCARELLALASKVIGSSNKIEGVCPEMVAAIALVESGGSPTAYRYERHLGEASAGLTQVLFSTARWLASDMGFDELGKPKTEEDLYRPEVAVYLCAGYLCWLRTYKGEERNDEFCVRGYNGGPNGINLAATESYWQKYQAALGLVVGEAGTAAAAQSGRVHVVVQGDTLYGIAKRAGVPLEELVSANPGVDPQRLRIGQELTIPAGGDGGERAERDEEGAGERRRGCSLM